MVRTESATIRLEGLSVIRPTESGSVRLCGPVRCVAASLSHRLLWLTPWSCESLPVISGMSSPAQERTGLNVALSCQVSHREALFHYTTPTHPHPRVCVAFSLQSLN